MSYPTSKPRIGITVTHTSEAKVYSDIVHRHGGDPWPIFPDHDRSPEETLALLDGLILGSGEDIDQRWDNAQPAPNPSLVGNGARDSVEFPILRAALLADISILGISRGMHALNIVLGGTFVQGISNHCESTQNGSLTSSYHRIFISPGSKLASIVGSGGFVRVNSRHNQAIREAHKSSMLIASAYSIQDGIIEAVESPSHSWVLGVQFQPEHRRELPPHFDRIFENLIKWAGSKTHRYET